MVSELSPEVRAKLEGLGHKIPDDAGVLPLNLRGVTSQQVAIRPLAPLIWRRTSSFVTNLTNAFQHRF